MINKNLKKIGRFEIIELISSGGMGEIYLAYDPLSKRKVALKQIKEQLLTHEVLKKRFINEALITSKLMHPSIIPIFEVSLDEKHPYYVMPYIEGKTLKKMLVEDQRNLKLDAQTIPLQNYVRIFYNICQAIHFIHTQKVLHRDLKPENIIIGTFGEVMIIDWGLAQHFFQQELDLVDVDAQENESLTHPGKIIGTVTYLAPEQAKEGKSNEQTDVYALGVILYQMLTLKLPHKRKNIKTFKKTIDFEKVRPPSKASPNREIPQDLEWICLKCIEHDPARRYQNIKSLLADLELHMQSRSKWQCVKQLHLGDHDDWQISADIALSKHLAISKTLESVEWVNVKVAAYPLIGNFKIKTTIQFEEECEGIGLLFSIPQKQNKVQLENGYCFWLSNQKSLKFFKSNVQIVEFKTVTLLPNTLYQIEIESIDDKIHLYIDQELVFSYISYLPIKGPFVGLLTKDVHCKMGPVHLFSGSLNQYVECTSIGDHYLANQLFDLALLEFRKIATAFEGQPIANIAAFKAGVTLLEKARLSQNENDYTRAHNEFELLQKTMASPLEYLGKAFVYEIRQEYEEEAKCYELALRKYPNHPYTKQIIEQLHFRLQSVSTFNRVATYHFLLIIAKFLPNLFTKEDTTLLIQTMKKDWQTLPFFEKTILDSPKDLAIALSFWLQKPLFILEILENLNSNYDLHLIENGTFALIELGELEMAKKYMDSLRNEYQNLYPLKLLNVALLAKQDLEQAIYEFFDFVPCNFTTKEKRVLAHLLELAQKQKRFDLIRVIKIHIDGKKLDVHDLKRIDLFLIQSHLYKNELEQAKYIFEKYEQKELFNENSSLFIPYLCFLLASDQLHNYEEPIATVSKSYPLTCAFLDKVYNKKEQAYHLFPYEKTLLNSYSTLLEVCKNLKK
jgi:serine/threonine-protein kinase